MPSLRSNLPGLTGLAAAAGGLGALTRLGRYHQGPVSDHFDGLRFFDPHGSAPKSFAELLRWCALTIERDATFAAAQRFRFRSLFVDEFQDASAAQVREP